MSISKHVVSLDLAEKLKDYFKECEFWWQDRNVENYDNEWSVGSGYIRTRKRYPAPLATEILERLPKEIPCEDSTVELAFLEICIHGETKQWLVQYAYTDDCRYLQSHIECSGTLPDALAEMYLLLTEKGLIKREEGKNERA